MKWIVEMITSKRPHAVLLFQTKNDVAAFDEAIRYVLMEHMGREENRKERLILRSVLADLGHKPEMPKKKKKPKHPDLNLDC